MKDVNVKIIPSSKDPLYTERETGITHTPFSLELSLFTAIKNGNKEALQKSIDDYYGFGFFIGSMSKRDDISIRYWAIATISTAIHYAILGGMDETDAYNLSDEWIRQVESLTGFESCLSFLEEKAYILTEKVRFINKSKFSRKISESIHYIHIHLHEKIKVEDIADHVGLSRDYLSALFKKEVGKSIHEYILEERIEASKSMISSGIGERDIAYTLCFCSQSHFITVFKRLVGMTPNEYRRKQ